LVTLSDQ